MAEENGRLLDIDVTDDHAFRTGVVQHLQFIVDKIAVVPDLKKKVDRHETIVKAGKWAAAPIVLALHGLVDHVLHKMGW